jgi:Flp pilus assembly protein TadD
VIEQNAADVRSHTTAARRPPRAALTLADLGRHEEALDAFDQAIRLNPEDSTTHNNRGIALASLGRHDEAPGTCDQGLSLASDDPSLHFNKGELLFGLSRLDDAEAELLIVTQLRPDDILGAAVLLAAIISPSAGHELGPIAARNHRFQ